MLSKKGKKLHCEGKEFGQIVARALKSELGATHQATKTVMGWTGASERTVKHWFAGTHGPSGQHLVALACYSDIVLTQFLNAANRNSFVVGIQLNSLLEKARELVVLIETLAELESS